MPAPMNPYDGLRLWFDFARMSMEAQSVIAMRVAGMAGFWSVTPSENMRMVTEKQQAAVAAMGAMSQAMLSGKSMDKIASAGLRPVGRKTAANVKRLGKRGPSLPK
ncbi:hypothetical protein BFP70_15745 [Thioclava sp. SK-1]|uniref:hypothetical protein n=1 Tax=Thioclava sp. SK-1 TaxID=1889770 RepID=UPI000825A00B|nr:hypothetical protein [Thioclava sp. SK-1]OCX60926.1 hypothetical protein BFP70_15745 [Thioclava sp. SK-1]